MSVKRTLPVSTYSAPLRCYCCVLLKTVGVDVSDTTATGRKIDALPIVEDLEAQPLHRSRATPQ